MNCRKFLLWMSEGHFEHVQVLEHVLLGFWLAARLIDGGLEVVE